MRPISLLFSFKKPISQSLVSDFNHHKSRHLSRQIKSHTINYKQCHAVTDFCLVVPESVFENAREIYKTCRYE